MLRGLRIHLRRGAQDQSGAALLLFTIMIPVIMGLIALSIDFGRYWILNSELQDLADAKALAAARELNGEDDAIDRAKDAAKEVNNDPRFADLALDQADSIAEYTFFIESEISLEPKDRHALSLAPDQQRVAAFVSVKTYPRTMLGSFIAALSPDLEKQTAAFATAGTQYVACKLTPLRLCWSPPSSFTATKGQQFRLRQNGNGSGVNGDFAIVDPPNQTNGNQTTLNLASPHPNFCFISQNTVTPGNKVSQVAQGMNVRFNMYDNGGGTNAAAVKATPPAPNIIKGYSGPANNTNKLCNPGQNDLLGTRLPRDSAFPDGWRGNGNWKGAPLEDYITAHHNSKPTAFKDKLRAASTRYELYLAELGLTEATESTMITKGATFPSTMPNGSESPYPSAQCGTSTDTQLDPRRRIIYVAIVDCSNNSGNSTPPRRTTKYAKFFMTEPVTPPSQNNELYAEFVGYIKPGDDNGVLHELVQLYE